MERDCASGRLGAFCGLIGAIMAGLWACTAFIMAVFAYSCAQAPLPASCLLRVIAEEGLTEGRSAYAWVGTRQDEASGPGARGAVFDPMPPLASLKTLLSGQGPGEQTLGALELGPEGAELSLAAGAWTLTASMVDESGAAMLSGQAEVFLVPGPALSVRIVMSPLEGLGSIGLSYPALVDAPAGTEWACRLENESGATVIEWVDEAENAGRVLEGLAAGYYALHTAVRAPEGALGSSVDVVRVLAGCQVAVTPSARQGRGSASISAEADSRAPLRVQARLASRLARRGIPAVLCAAGEPGGQEPTYRWYAMGTELANGSLARIPTGALPAKATVDLLATAPDGRLGAATLELIVSDGPRVGPWLHYCTLGEQDEPEASALASPVALASSADGAALAMLSDASGSRLDLWLRGEADEPRPVAGAAIRVGGTARRGTVLALSPDASWTAAANGDSDWLWLAPIERGQDGSAAFGSALEYRSSDPGLEGLSYVRALAFSPDGSRLFALCNQARVVLGLLRGGATWSIESTTPLDAFPCGELSGYRAMSVSPDGSLLALAAASSDAVVILGLSEGGLFWRGMVAGATGGIDYPQALAFSPDGRYLAVASRDAGLAIVECQGEPSVVALRGSEAGIPASVSAIAWARGSLALAHPQGLSLIDASVEQSGLLLAAAAESLSGQDMGQERGATCIESLGPWLACAGREPGSLALLAHREPGGN